MKKLAVHCVPRSGSTWLGSILDAHPNVVYKFQPLFSYALKDFLSPSSSYAEIQKFFEILEKITDPFLDQIEAKAKGSVPEFLKKAPEILVYKEVRYHHIVENLLEKDNELKVVGLVRNPLSCLYSWYKAPKEFRADLGWRIEDEWLNAPSKNLNKPEEFNGYIKWKEVAYLFEKLSLKFQDRFFLVRYSDLLKDTDRIASGLFQFIDATVDPQVTNFIRESKLKSDNDPYGVYKIKDHDSHWKGKLPAPVVEYIVNDLKGTSLEKFLS